jgi:prolyl oligopeptidase
MMDSRGRAARHLLRIALGLTLLLATLGPPRASAAARTEVPSEGADVDTLHGVTIVDPFRWLEDFGSPRAQTWIAGQESVTARTLGSVPDRERIRKRLAQLFEIPSLGGLWFRGDRLFFQRRAADEEQAILYVQDGLDGEPKLVIDPDALGDGAPVTLDWWYPSDDGRLLAYGLSEGGSEMSTLHVMDVDRAADLPDLIPRTRLAAVSWRPDGSGFYYTRFPDPADVPEGEEFFHRKVFYHALGAEWRDDPLVFGDGLEMHSWTGVSVSVGGRFLLGYAYHGSAQNDLFVRDIEHDRGWIPVAEGLDSRFSGIAIGDTLYTMTTLDAPNGRIYRVDLGNPARDAWVEIVPEGEHAIQSYAYAGGRLMVLYLENAQADVEIYGTDGRRIARVPLPGPCSVLDWTSDPRGPVTLLEFNSFLTPPTVLSYNVASAGVDTVMAVDAPIDTRPYVSEQIWYTSRDGTPVSMFLVHRREIALDGDNPTILTGYGGFGTPVTPEFARNRYLWLESGGVWAEPNLRGGGEYGEAWHRAGMLGNKQNTFDDFIAAAEWLIEKGYTRPDRLAVWGGSNGGLLVTAFVTQRPELAAAAIADVPLTDMLRFHLLYGGSAWVPEYGSPDDPEAFDWLLAYSPYQHVVEGTSYPAVYLTTGETDTRVHPSHALKMAARLEDATASRRPILLRYERDAGHGMGVRRSTLLDEYVDYYSFLFLELGVRYPR